MIEEVLKALKASKSIAAWKINLTKTESSELFYVQKKVETVRATDTTDCSVTVYVDSEGKRGESSFSVYPYMNAEDIASLIEENVFAAKFTLNKFYELPKPVSHQKEEVKSNLADEPFSTLIAKIGAAIQEANVMENASLSATEVFLYKITKRVINSSGIDDSSSSYECKIETIPNYVKGKEEVEIYQAISFASFSPKALTEKVAESLRLVRDRANAVPMPKVGPTAVILEDENSERFLETFADDLGYNTAYMHGNLFSPGDDMQEGRTADALNITMRPFVEGALSSCFLDRDGVYLSPIEIIKDGKAINRHGLYRYGYYLGEKNPTGLLPILDVKEGNSSFDYFKKKPYIRVVRFSDMQADLNDGFFGGEVRLAYYFDGEKEIPVTGLTIQGDYQKAKGSFLLSKERVVLDSYTGPRYVYIPDVVIL